MSSQKALFWDAKNGKLDFQGSQYRINNMDYAQRVDRSVSIGSGYLALTRLGNLVMCKFGAIPNAQFDKSIIPNGFRPIVNMDFLAWYTNNNDRVYSATVTTEGTVSCSSFPSNSGLWGHVSYICNEAYP